LQRFDFRSWQIEEYDGVPHYVVGSGKNAIIVISDIFGLSDACPQVRTLSRCHNRRLYDRKAAVAQLINQQHKQEDVMMP
jgi:hypothetical protein